MLETNSATYRMEFEPALPRDKKDFSVHITVEAANLSTEQHKALRESLNEFCSKIRRIVE